MPRFKQKGVLERSAVSDLWKHTLSRIPTTIGRVVYLAGLRDSNSGAYRHHGLVTVFGRDESTRALRESHEQTFAEFLVFSLEEKFTDLNQHLVSVEEPAQTSPRTIADHWLRSRTYKLHVPDAAREMERALYCRDLEALLVTIRNAAA
jgi:hypothetical protein